LSALLAVCTREWVNAGPCGRGDSGVELPDTVAEEDWEEVGDEENDCEESGEADSDVEVDDELVRR
jgi:hypothetical protein